MIFIFKLISRLLALVTLVFILLYGYSAYLMNQTESTGDVLNNSAKSGNGYGGETGMKILDSNFKSNDYFWVTDNLLLFSKSRPQDENGNGRSHYIWDVEQDEILPLEIPGSANCFLRGSLYYLKHLNPNRRISGRRSFEVFQAQIKRGADSWLLEDTKNIEEIWPLPSNRWARTWRPAPECSPWFHLPEENRLPTDMPVHYFISMPEWGWIYRKPSDNLRKPGTNEPEMGFIDLSQAPYFNQIGIKVREPLNIPAQYRGHAEFRYIKFLDRYWIATRLYHDPKVPKYLALLDREGNILRFNWPTLWPFYEGLPSPTRKGVFWASADYRLPSPSLEDYGGYILTEENTFHKVIHGGVERISLSPDGCKVAFYHTPGPTKINASRLRVFHVCNSSIQGREMTDVQYRDRPG